MKRVRLQSRVWFQATIMQQQQPFEPLNFGYYKNTNGQILPVTTKVLPAPQAVIELVRCKCKTDCSTLRCSCRKNNLPCTELCSCDTRCANSSFTSCVKSPSIGSFMTALGKFTSNSHHVLLKPSCFSYP